MRAVARAALVGKGEPAARRSRPVGSARFSDCMISRHIAHIACQGVGVVLAAVTVLPVGTASAFPAPADPTSRPSSVHRPADDEDVVEAGGLVEVVPREDAAAKVKCSRRTGPHQRAVEKWLKLKVDGKQSAADCRAVQRVAGPQLVRPGRLEPAEHLLLPRPGGRAVQLEPLEQPLQRPVRRRPAGLRCQDPPHLRRGPLRVLPLQRRRQYQQVTRRAGRGLPGRGNQRPEPAGQVIPLPAVDRLTRK